MVLPASALLALLRARKVSSSGCIERRDLVDCVWQVYCHETYSAQQSRALHARMFETMSTAQLILTLNEAGVNHRTCTTKEELVNLAVSSVDRGISIEYRRAQDDSHEIRSGGLQQDISSAVWSGIDPELNEGEELVFLSQRPSQPCKNY